MPLRLRCSTALQCMCEDKMALPKPSGPHQRCLARVRASIPQAPARDLPHDGQAGARVRAAKAVPLGCCSHQPHQQRQRRVHQRVLQAATQIFKVGGLTLK